MTEEEREREYIIAKYGTDNIRIAVQARIAAAWGWNFDEPEAKRLAENFAMLAPLMVYGTRTQMTTLVSALLLSR